MSGTIVKAQIHRTIDMIVVMPREMFQDKDYLNLRYFHKRAYYLAVLSAGVRDKLASIGTISYDKMHGNHLLPVLVIGSKAVSKDPEAKVKASQQTYQIRIIPCAPEGLFPGNKLLPTSCNIRSTAADEGTPIQTPTPFYNSTLKAETCYLSYLKVIRQAEKTCSEFTDACILGRIWLQQRGLGSSVTSGGFGHFEWSLLAALLLQGGGRKGVAALSPSLSSTQIFKAVIQYLAAADLAKRPVILGPIKEAAKATKDPGPVMFDSARQLNFAFKMSSWSASMLQHYAKWTHTSLADQNADQFNPTFITKTDVALQCFDLVIQIDSLEAVRGAQAQDHRGESWALGDRMARVLKRALGDRADLIHLRFADNTAGTHWNLDSTSTSAPSTIMIGIALNPVNMARQVDQGPAVEEKEAAKRFRQFWGEKAELRRFKDGSIMESLIWTQTSSLGICEEISRYILKLHLHLHDEDMNFYGKEFSAMLPVKSADWASFQAARQAFTVFERDLRDLGNLPLQIRQVAATGPELRFASVRPPSIQAAKGDIQAMDTTIYFEASGKWPENLAAVQRTKVAFLLRIGELLSKSKTGLTCRVGLEDVQTEVENLAFLDVSYEDGSTFRLRIHSDLEENLIERRTKDKTLDQRLRTQGAQLLSSFKRLYTQLPLHTQTIATCASRFPALSPTIRLVKHWFDAHKLSSHFLEETIELFALKVFLEPYPWQAPSSAMTGFLRTLQFLSRWDWRMDALIVDFSGTLLGTERSSIETRLEAWRNIDPGMSHTTLFVATPHDTSGTAYTIHDGRPYPSKVVATRMTSLARSACKLVRERGLDLEPKSLFQPVLKDYDVLIHLNGKALKNINRVADGGKQSRFKNLDGRTGKMLKPMVQQPARTLLMQLESLFSGPLLLFHGAADDTIIAGIWDPQIKRRTFRVNLACSFRPVGAKEANGAEDDGELVEVNRQGIIAEIGRIGGDYIEKIDVAKRS